MAQRHRVLIIGGGYGGLYAAKALAGSRLLRIRGMGHDLPRTRWAEIAHEIRTNADRASTFDAVAAAS